MDISELTTSEAIEAVEAMDSVEDLRVAAGSIGLKFSGNTGEATLRVNLMKKLNEQAPPPAPEDEEDQEEDDEEVDTSQIDKLFGGNEDEVIEVAKKPKKKKPTTANDLLMMDANAVEDPILRRQIVRAQALVLKRVRVTSLDPNDSQLDGAIFTVSNKYTGKVSKYVPFAADGDSGWHVPQIILSHIENVKFAMRREIKGGQFGVKRYKTVMTPRYSVEYLPSLTEKELKELAAHQRASNAIDQ